MGSVVSSLNIEGSDVQPLVPRFRVIFKDLRSSELSIKAPIQPEPALDEGQLSVGQCSWEGCQGSPGCRSREEGQNRRLVSSGNNKCPSGRKSGTGMVPSTLRQLGELLDKAINIVPCDEIVGLASCKDNGVFVEDPTCILPAVL